MKAFPRKVFLLLLLAGFLAGLSEVHASGYLTASGCSVSNAGYLTELAKEYEKQTGVKVLVRGGGSVIGIEDVRSGRVDFGASCRNRAPGDPEDIDFVQVAWDALVFIVHPSNPLNDISLADARAIYSGKVTNWKQLKGKDIPIKVFISRGKKGLSGVENSTKEMILKGREPVETPATTFFPSTGLVEQVVEKAVDGFATTGFSSARKRSVKMLRVDGAYPEKTTIASREYPFRRPLFLVVPKYPKPAVTEFVRFLLSRKGQQFISSRGMVSLPDVK